MNEIHNASPDGAVEKVLDEAVRQGERTISICRILFVLAILARFLWLNDLSDPAGRLRIWLFIPAAICFIAFSAWMVARTRKGPIPTKLLALSVALDASMAFAGLAPNGMASAAGNLTPERAYAGNFGAPDGASILLMLMISSLRLSPQVVWVSAATNTASVVVLVYIDATISAPPVVYGRHVFILMAILGAATVLVAQIVARKTRRLVMAGAHDSLRAYRIQQALSSVLQDNHDVRSLLSSANLDAALLLRDPSLDQRQRAQAERLCDDLRAVTSLISTLRERAFLQLVASNEPPSASVSNAIRVTTALVTARFPDVSIHDLAAPDLGVRVAGGAIMLERVLFNLMINACEGDGIRGATTIWLRAHRERECVKIRLEDDGPGFPEAMLGEPSAHTGTSKRDGSGLGLFLLQTVIRASHGRVILGKRFGGGAYVEILLPDGRERIR
jgi:signal transduction histidine kinase